MSQIESGSLQMVCPIHVVFRNFLQKMSDIFKLVLIRVAYCTPVVPILIHEQSFINCKIM